MVLQEVRKMPLPLGWEVVRKPTNVTHIDPSRQDVIFPQEFTQEPIPEVPEASFQARLVPAFFESVDQLREYEPQFLAQGHIDRYKIGTSLELPLGVRYDESGHKTGHPLAYHATSLVNRWGSSDKRKDSAGVWHLREGEVEILQVITNRYEPRIAVMLIGHEPKDEPENIRRIEVGFDGLQEWRHKETATRAASSQL